MRTNLEGITGRAGMLLRTLVNRLRSLRDWCWPSRYLTHLSPSPLRVSEVRLALVGLGMDRTIPMVSGLEEPRISRVGCQPDWFLGRVGPISSDVLLSSPRDNSIVRYNEDTKIVCSDLD